MTLHIINNESEQILFIYEVEKLTPEELHIEVSTAIDKEFERMKVRLEDVVKASNL